MLKEAENSPCLPSLPVLAAYVRACEGNVPEWEERWRRLGGDETRADPHLPVRHAGASAAAVAGARAGIGVVPPEAYDPARIRAALRGDQGISAEASRRNGQSASSATQSRTTGPDGTGWDAGASRESWDSRPSLDSGPGWDSGTSRDTAARSVTGWAWDSNASREASTAPETGAGWDAGAGRDTPGSWDSSTRWDTRESWDTSASRDTAAGLGAGTGWETAPGNGIGQPNGNHHAKRPPRGPFEAAVTEARDTSGHGTDREERTALADDRGTDREERSALAGHAGDAAERARAIRADPFSASWLQDGELTSRPDDGRFSWLDSTPRPRNGEPAAEPRGGELAGQPGPAADLSQAAGSAAATQARTPAERPGPTAASQPRNRRKDKAFSVRLLVVIVLAALIGSVLVMMLR